MYKKLILSAIAITGLFASSGKDISVDTNKDLYVHSIYCGDVSKMYTMKPAIIYTNTKEIENGTYYFKGNDLKVTMKYEEVKGFSKVVMSRTMSFKRTPSSKPYVRTDVCMIKKSKLLSKRYNSAIDVDFMKAGDTAARKDLSRYFSYFGEPITK